MALIDDTRARCDSEAPFDHGGTREGFEP